jgi:flagellar hook-associated protein 2
VGNRDAATINLEQGATLADLRDAINKADAGVSATIINDGSSDRLVITSNESGTANQIALTGSSAAISNFNETVAARNAELEIDGISVTSASNTITAISGITLELTGTTGSNPVTLRVANDTAPLKERMQAFVTAYNNIRSTLGELSRFDASGDNSGVLSGDSTVRMVLDRVRGVLTSPQSGVDINGPFPNLASVGIRSNSDGTLQFDEDAFNAAIGSDFAGMTQTLSTYAAAFDRVATNITASDGIIANRTNALNISHRSLGDRVEGMNRLLSQTEARFRAQFGALDALMARFQTTSNFLSQQLSALQPR